MSDTEWRAEPMPGGDDWGVVAYIGSFTDVVAIGLDKATAHRIAAVNEMERALENALEVIQFAYMNAPKQPKEIAEIRAALTKAQPK